MMRVRGGGGDWSQARAWVARVSDEPADDARSSDASAADAHLEAAAKDAPVVVRRRTQAVDDLAGSATAGRPKSGLTVDSTAPPLQITEIRVRRDARCALEIDERFARRGIVTGPQGRLIDAVETTALWHEAPGRKPEDLLASHPAGAIAVCPTNFGWQRGAFLVRSGRVVALPDDDLLDGPFPLLGLGPAGWAMLTIELRSGRPASAADQERIRGLAIGLEMPLLVKQGRVAAIEDLVTTPRLLADLRNAFDFADGRGTEIPQEVWGRLRSVMPASSASARSLARGETCAELHSCADAASLAEQLHADLARLGFHHIDPIWTGTTVGLAFTGAVPLQRLPLVGIGITADRDLIVIAVDGRRADAPGATIAELGEVLREAGAEYAGLGSAGGDVAVVARTDEGTVLVNCPSTDDPATREPTTRPVPSLLVMS